MKYLILLVALCSCATPLDECCLEKVVLDRSLSDPGKTAFSFVTAFQAADANSDDKVEGHEWHEFALSMVAQLKASQGAALVNPITLDALRRSGIVLTDPLFAVDGAVDAVIDALRTR